MKKRDFKSILMLIKQHIMKRDELVVLPKTEVVGNDFGVIGGTVRSWDCRNVIPHEVILDYCVKENLDVLNIFYDNEEK